jgi:uncharacterized protein (DUF1499 family)
LHKRALARFFYDSVMARRSFGPIGLASSARIPTIGLNNRHSSFTKSFMKDNAMKVLQGFVILVMVLAVGLVIAGQLGWLSGSQPKLGVLNGRLKPPSNTPNSACSQAVLYPDHPQKDYAAIAPLAFKGDATQAMAKLADLLQKTERTVVVTRGPDYIYAQSTTALLKFTDDVEFWLDAPNSVIQVRSSSRLGRKDFGVNKARIEAIRALYSTQ